MPTAAVLLATSVSADDSPAAALNCGPTTLIARLTDQLQRLGVDRGWVLTRPSWEPEIKAIAAASDLQLEVRTSPSTAQDLRTVADIAATVESPVTNIVLASADILTHREALAGLLADPRISTGILSTTASPKGSWAPRTRAERGRLVSAGSGYHKVRKPTGYFLGVLKIDLKDRDQLVRSVRQLADLTEHPVPPRWEEAFQLKRARWRRGLTLKSLTTPEGEVPVATEEELDALPLDEESARTLELRTSANLQDALPLILVGLVRSRVHLTNSYLRELFWARPLSQETTDAATEKLGNYDEDRVLLNSAVKGSDGFFTTHFVSPYSRYIARWAARRGFTPNGITTFSMALGTLAAVAFALGSRPGLIAGALLLQAAFTFDCVDGQLARYTRRFSKLGAWLDSVFDRGKEYVVFAGLAIGATTGFGDNVWALAAAALALQTVRHTVDFSFAASRHQVLAALPVVPLDQPEDRRVSAADAEAPVTAEEADEDEVVEEEPEPQKNGSALARVGKMAVRLSRALERRSWMRWLKKIVVLPIGERFALISLTAALWEPRVTFIALLVWGGFALAYQLTGRILRSVAA